VEDRLWVPAQKKLELKQGPLERQALPRPKCQWQVTPWLVSAPERSSNPCFEDKGLDIEGTEWGSY